MSETINQGNELENGCACEDTSGSACSTCGEMGSGCSGGSCGGGEPNPMDLIEAPHPMSNIKKVIGVVSGKGGVGKSLVTSVLAVELKRRGFNVGILDGDITGPSIPRIFGLREKAEGSDGNIIPVTSKSGIPVISINVLLERESDPVLWRGPVIAGVVKQFWTDVIWGDLDFLLVDMPPGTGDVPVTVFQSLPIDGIVIVTSPQELVSMIVGKAVTMANLMDIPVVGIVENMSYIKCPDCGKEIPVFGESKANKVADEYGLDLLAKLPLDANLANACDKGLIELFNENWLEQAADKLEAVEPRYIR